MIFVEDNHRAFILGICLIIITAAPPSGSAGETADVSLSVQAVQIRDMIASRVSVNAEWALAAMDVGAGGRQINEGSARNVPLVPGSLMKLLVTAAILDQNTREAIDLRTVVAVQGTISGGTLLGDIIIKGAGNPLLSGQDLVTAVEKIKSLGIQGVTGSVIADDSLFDVRNWNGRYSGPAYGRPSALGLDLHTVLIAVDGNNVLVDPPNDAVKISLNPKGKLGIRQIDDRTYEVTGASGNIQAFHRRFSVDDPALYAAGTLMTLLRKKGIPVSGVVKRGSQPDESSEVVRLGAYDLKAMIRDTNQQSLNVAADNLLLLLGAVSAGRPGTREKGIEAVNNFLRSLDIPQEGVTVIDGSGVSDGNRISARHLAAMLHAISKKPWFPAFFDSLSRPGMDGRLRDFGYTSGRFHVKSGQLREAYGLAGYADRPDGEATAFAYMVNGRGSDMQAAASAAVEVMKVLGE
jgi:D-alanyl-D-alanine carboxypeptidase/D-alanyl-D-alanine-endopeptidase (penicillin-binding protein 4)